MRSIVALTALSLVLAACAKIESPQEAREAAQAAQAEYDRLAASARDGDDIEEDIIGAPSPGQINTASSAQLTEGSWSVATADGERMARFGAEGEAPLVTIACEVGGGIDVRLLGMTPEGGTATVFFSSPEGGSTFTASAGVGDQTGAYVSVPGDDPFVGRLIGGNGPFSIRMGGSQNLTFPADDVLTSVVSACDRRESDDAGTADPAETPAEAEAETDAQ